MGVSSKIRVIVMAMLLICSHIASEQDVPSVSAPDANRQGTWQQQQEQQPEPVTQVPIPETVPIAQDSAPDTPDAGKQTPDWINSYYNNNNGRGNCPPIMIPMPGPAGPPGLPGHPGPTGGTGPSGMPGNHGNNGNNGMPGIAGPAGQKGAKGEQGYPGISGSPGVPGPRGDQGHQGSPGTPGHMGLAGSVGKHGLPGPRGVQGDSGLPGFPGANGEPGEKGEPGSDGVCNCDTQPRHAVGARTSAFSVARTSGLTATDGPITVTFQHVFTNVGDDFDVNTGKFNCSIPGVYFFTINVYKSSTQNFPLVQILLNGEHQAAVIDYGSADAEDSTTNSIILSLNRGDLVWLQLYDGRELYSSHYRFTTFSGFRIG